MARVFLCIIVVSILSIFTLQAKEVKRVTIALGEFAPFTGKELPGYGCSATLYQDIFRARGYKTKILFMPWERAYMESKQGAFDATGHWLDKPQRRKDFNFPNHHVAIEKLYFYYDVNKPFDWKSYADLIGRELIINKGYTYSDDFYQALKKYNIQHQIVIEAELNLKMIIKQRADITIMEKKLADYHLNQLHYAKRQLIKMHPDPAIVSRGYLLFSKNIKNSEELIRDFDSGFKQVMLDKSYLDQYLKNCSEL